MMGGHPLADQFVAGCLAGGAAVAVLHPLDLLKTRFQATSSGEYQRLFSVPRQLQAIYQHGGVPALYRGFTANLAGSTCSWGLYFVFYRIMQERLRSAAALQPDQSLSSPQYFLASGTAGLLTVLLCNPLWLAKTRLCQPPVNGPPSLQYSGGLIDCLRKTRRAEGLAGLYRGLPAGLLGTVHGAVQFMTYERLKAATVSIFQLDRPLGTLEFLLLSASSKIVASLLTYPYQVVRCRMQLSPILSPQPAASQAVVPPGPRLPIEGSLGYPFKSMADVLSRTWRYVAGRPCALHPQSAPSMPILLAPSHALTSDASRAHRQEGILGFYKGIVPGTIRVLPGTCITFIVYEKLVRHLASRPA